jgi:hypothetical protein
VQRELDLLFARIHIWENILGDLEEIHRLKQEKADAAEQHTHHKPVLVWQNPLNDPYPIQSDNKPEEEKSNDEGNRVLAQAEDEPRISEAPHPDSRCFAGVKLDSQELPAHNRPAEETANGDTPAS